MGGRGGVRAGMGGGGDIHEHACDVLVVVVLVLSVIVRRVVLVPVVCCVRVFCPRLCGLCAVFVCACVCSRRAGWRGGVVLLLWLLWCARLCVVALVGNFGGCRWGLRTPSREPSS
jgi:hypothetical protein